MNVSDMPYEGILFRSVKFQMAFVCTVISATRSINKWAQSGRIEPSVRDLEQCTFCNTHVYKVNKLTFNTWQPGSTDIYFYYAITSLNLFYVSCSYIVNFYRTGLLHLIEDIRCMSEYKRKCVLLQSYKRLFNEKRAHRTTYHYQYFTLYVY